MKGMIETRPYMRARFDLAMVYWEADRLEEAVSHFEALLELNPNDNQGVRYYLLPLYLQNKDLEGTGSVYKRYPGDICAVFHWSRVLERLMAGDEKGALRALEAARNQNPHFEDYLTGKKRIPAEEPDYYSVGDKSEAVAYARCLRPAWKGRRGSIQWLKEQGRA